MPVYFPGSGLPAGVKPVGYDLLGWPTQQNKIIFDGQDLTAWIGRGANAGGGTIATATSSTITEALDVLNGPAGGTLITMDQTLSDGTKNVLTSPYLRMPYKGDRAPWFFTAEIKMPTNGWCVLDITNELPANLIDITIGNPNNQIKVSPTGGTTLTVTPSDLDQTKHFRILVAVIPTSDTDGRVRTYVYHAAGRAFIGETTYSSATIFPTRLKVTQKFTGANTMYLSRSVVGLVSGVMMGCSLEAGYFGFNMAPQIARDTGIYEIGRNPANLIGAMFNGSHNLHGSGDWVINNARGGYTAAQMRADFTDWVTALSPRWVVIGSMTNSIVAALSAPDVSAYMDQVKSDVAWMIAQAQAVGARVFATGIAPRHESVTATLGLAAYAALAKDYNAWLKQKGIAVYDPWNDLEDPANPNQLNPLYDGNDHVHYNKNGQVTIARRQYEAWSGWLIPRIVR